MGVRHVVAVRPVVRFELPFGERVKPLRVEEFEESSATVSGARLRDFSQPRCPPCALGRLGAGLFGWRSTSRAHKRAGLRLTQAKRCSVFLALAGREGFRWSLASALPDEEPPSDDCRDPRARAADNRRGRSVDSGGSVPRPARSACAGASEQHLGRRCRRRPRRDVRCARNDGFGRESLGRRRSGSAALLQAPGCPARTPCVCYPSRRRQSRLLVAETISAVAALAKKDLL